MRCHVTSVYKSSGLLFKVTHLLYGAHDGCHDEHDGERDHDPVGEVVDVEVERHVADAHEDEGLEEGVGHVELEPAPEDDLDDGLADVVDGHDLQGLHLDLVLDQDFAACGDLNLVIKLFFETL